MENDVYILKKIATLMNLGIFCLKDNQLESYQEHPEYNPIYCSDSLRTLLKQGASNQKDPYIYKDKHSIYFASIRVKTACYFIGPMSIALMERMDLYPYYRFYEIQETAENRQTLYTFSEILDLIESVANILLGKEYTDNQLIYANHLIEKTKEEATKEQVLFELTEGEEALYHHTYQEERKLLHSIVEGRREDALRYSRNMDADLGKLAKKELNHWKNVAIVAITLCTRAAIEGGISPVIAYHISDFYIQKSDECKDIAQIIKYRDHAIEDLTDEVQRRQRMKTSSYVDQCIDYINKHYREKVYLSELAEMLNLTPTYLSRHFKKKTGISIQEYIINVRMEHVANLLKYSDKSIAYIAEYVNFPSQSYMGRMFRERYGITPRKYRENNRLAQYFENNSKK